MELKHLDLDQAQQDADSFFRYAEGEGLERQANFAAMTKVLIAEVRRLRAKA